ncbi:type VI secretion system protein TssA [Geomonas nitrogeniifigens]|uniref:type VI secretion system protein TssA n=1 Tax=Geomonas diazotrophica TaxID=2843197 RepID=UPI001C2C3B1C|nr:type VI secretion system protein TssA [Geomonas nitrogeniifigens]QXE87773.1 type VI secretion system protein TssA [Geomonas nitrogeniifigens]
MIRDLSVEKLLLPISSESPAGSDLRYTTVYEEIMEARRCEDAVAMGDWQHDVKQANWDKVISLAATVLGTRSKDLQIAAWLAEALTVTEGFAGLELGLELTTGLTELFWETVYPQTEEGDLEYRATPFRFLDGKVALQVRQIPLTDPELTPGYSWHEWRRSREVGSEADVRNRYGEVDEDKKSRREQLLAESAVSPEEFDAAVARSSGGYAAALCERLAACSQRVQRLAKVLDDKFPSAPSLYELSSAVDDCRMLVDTLYREQAENHATAPMAGGAEAAITGDLNDLHAEKAAVRQVSDLPAAASVASVAGLPEHSLWGEALARFESGGLQEALAMLLYSGNGADSIRDRNRVRLLMGKLCLKAGRSDLARPIIEELHGIIEELHLERWESPLWVAEVLVAYYQCLQAGGPRECDLDLSQALFRRICLLDVTKAMPYSH